jgi:transposase-like protein
MSDLRVIDKARVVAALVSGASVPEVAREFEISPSTIRRWSVEDEGFQEMLENAEQGAITAILEDAIQNVRFKIKELGTKALSVLTSALESDDERTRLAAAKEVFKLAGIATTEKHVQLGLESVIGEADGNSPTAGD